MKLRQHYISILAVSSVMTGCTLAPLTSPSGGTTLGEGNTRVAGHVLTSTGVSVGHGVTENLDVGVSLEQLIRTTYGVWGKYSVLNQKTGPAVAVLGGGFRDSDDNSHGYYAGPTASYATGKLEWYGTLRYNNVTWDGPESLTNDEDEILISIFEVDDTNFSYWQTEAGVKIKASQNGYVDIGATCLRISGDQTCLPSFGVGVDI